MSRSSMLRIRITGKTALMLHNGQLANPLNQYAKRIHNITAKKKKTENDLMDIARIEFEGGLYLDDEGRVIAPARCIRRALVLGARKSKNGKGMEEGSEVLEDAVLKYRGPRDVQGMWEAGMYDVCNVVIQRRKTLRCRPVFQVPWSFDFVVGFDLLKPDEVLEAVRVVCEQIGWFENGQAGFGKATYEVLPSGKKAAEEERPAAEQASN